MEQIFSETDRIFMDLYGLWDLYRNESGFAPEQRELISQPGFDPEQKIVAAKAFKDGISLADVKFFYSREFSSEQMDVARQALSRGLTQKQVSAFYYPEITIEMMQIKVQELCEYLSTRPWIKNQIVEGLSIKALGAYRSHWRELNFSRAEEAGQLNTPLEEIPLEEIERRAGKEFAEGIESFICQCPFSHEQQKIARLAFASGLHILRYPDGREEAFRLINKEN